MDQPRNTKGQYKRREVPTRLFEHSKNGSTVKDITEPKIRFTDIEERQPEVPIHPDMLNGIQRAQAAVAAAEAATGLTPEQLATQRQRDHEAYQNDVAAKQREALLGKPQNTIAERDKVASNRDGSNPSSAPKMTDGDLWINAAPKSNAEQIKLKKQRPKEKPAPKTDNDSWPDDVREILFGIGAIVLCAWLFAGGIAGGAAIIAASALWDKAQAYAHAQKIPVENSPSAP